MNNKFKLMIKGFALLGTVGFLLSCGGGGGGGTTAPARQGSFDNGTLDGWLANGLWHVTTRRASNGSDSVWFGQEATGDYDTGAPNIGAFTSPPIILGVAPSISFDYFLDNECPVTFPGPPPSTNCINDNFIVQITVVGSGITTDLVDLDLSNLGFTSHTIDSIALATFASSTVQIRFLFGANDFGFNNFEGAYVDNIVLNDADYQPGIFVPSPNNNQTLEEVPMPSPISISLISQPSADVSVTFSSDTPAEGVIQGNATVTFNASNWFIPQTVNIVGVDEAIVDGETPYTIVTAPAVSSDPLYNTLDPNDFSMVNVDDDGPVAACSGAIMLADDDSVKIALGFSFPFAGFNWDSVFVGSNGYLTFGLGSTNNVQAVDGMINFYPRIAGLFDDLDPTASGAISCSSTTNSATFSYAAVPEFGPFGANSFDITLNNDGSIQITYGAISATDGLAGISYGFAAPGLTDPGEIDLSVPPVHTIWPLVYEQFADADNDLSGISLTFNNITNIQTTILNGSFETGDFTDWVTHDIPSGPLVVNFNAPSDGAFGLNTGFDGDGRPGNDKIFVAQDVDLSGQATASVSFDWEVFLCDLQDNIGAIATLPRVFSLEIEPAGGGASLFSQTIFTCPIGINSNQSPVDDQVIDISAVAGQAVRIKFQWLVPESFTGPGGARLDDVRLLP